MIRSSSLSSSARSVAADSVDLKESPRRLRAWVGIVILGAFGPYLSRGMGIRTEQLLIYASALLLFPALLLRARITRTTFLVFYAWVGIIMASVAGGLLAVRPVPTNNPLSGLDNLVLPIASVLVVHGWRAVSGRRRKQSLLYVAEKWIVICLCLNALVALYSVVADINSWGNFFWTAGVDPTASVAAKAATMGRHTGLFNQPLESGIAYSVGLFVFMHMKRGNRLQGWQSAILLLLVLSGGLLSVSKVFLLLGLPLAIFGHLTRSSARLKPRGILLTASVLVGLMVLAAYVPWEGRDRLEQTIRYQTEEGALSFYSSGRLGPDGSSRVVVETVLKGSALFGFGLSGLDVAYDNAWIEMMVLGGIVAVGFYTLVLGILVFKLFRGRRLMSSNDWWLTASLVVLVILGGIGGPTLTTNRSGVLVWILLTFVLLLPEDVNSK